MGVFVVFYEGAFDLFTNIVKAALDKVRYETKILFWRKNNTNKLKKIVVLNRTLFNEKTQRNL